MKKQIYELGTHTNPNNQSLDEHFAESVNKFYDENYGTGKAEKKQAEKEAKLASGEWIEVDGKIYDARFYKGNK